MDPEDDPYAAYASPWVPQQGPVVPPPAPMMSPPSMGQTGGFQNPQLLSALASGALQLGQPMGFGQYPFGHLLESIGAAGGSARASEKIQREEEEAASKQDLRASQAEAAAARAGAAGSAAEAARSRLGIQQSEYERKVEAGRTTAILGAQRAYNMEVLNIRRANDAAEKANANLLRDPKAPFAPILPIPTIQEWYDANPKVRAIVESATPSGAPKAPAAGKPSVDESDPFGLGAGLGAKAPPAPTDPKDRIAGTTYNTPKGDLRWTGTGWIAP